MAQGHTITIQGVPCPVKDLGTRSNAEMANLASLMSFSTACLWIVAKLGVLDF